MKWEEAKKHKDGLQIIPEKWIHVHYFDALNILFRLENTLRVFVYSVLKNQFYSKWQNIDLESDDAAKGTIGSISKKRINQARDFGYLCHPVNCPMMFLTAGELIRIITSESYWKFFSRYFPGKREIIKNKLDEIGVVRNSLAHFRPIRKSDIEVLRQNALHSFSDIEEYLRDLFLIKKEIVPTNLNESWYQKLRRIDSDLIKLKVFWSKSCKWVLIDLVYTGPTEISEHRWENAKKYKVVNINTSEIVAQNQNLLDYTTYVTERIGKLEIDESGKLVFQKSISLVFSIESLSLNVDLICDSIVKILEKVQVEYSEVIKVDGASGSIVQPVLLHASKKSDARWWSFDSDVLRSLSSIKDPPEFWGAFSHWEGEVISDVNDFPWMHTSVCDAIPF